MKPKFTGTITAEAESKRIKMNLPMLITEQEDINPIIGMYWLRKIIWQIRHIEKMTTLTNISERDKIFTQIEKLSRGNKQLMIPRLQYN